MPQHLNSELLKKLADKLHKTRKYTREQISRKASAAHVVSPAYLVYWAGQLGIGTGRFFSSLAPNIQEQARSLEEVLPARRIQPVSLQTQKVTHKVLGRKAKPRSYVDQQRLHELRSLSASRFDLRRLIEMCVELNHCFRREDFIALITLLRSILNHVPPIFGNKTFTEVRSSTSIAKSNRESFDFLDTHSRKIADAYLHIPIRDSEILPTSTQIDFSQSLDVLLGEVVRVLK